MIKSKSSHISHLNYNPSTKSLEVQFTSGSVYQYANVDEKTWLAFRDAESHGRFLASRIAGVFKHKLTKPAKKKV